MKMKFLLGLTLAATTAAAGTGTGTVTGFIPGNVASGTAVFVFQTSSNSPLASCNQTQRFAIASTNPQYNSTVAAVIAAFASGASVTAIGLGTCNVVGNAEDLNYVCVGTLPC